MTALIGELKVPGVIAVVLMTALGYSWIRGVESASNVNYWPAKDPALMKRVLAASDADASAMLPIESD